MYLFSHANFKLRKGVDERYRIIIKVPKCAVKGTERKVHIFQRGTKFIGTKKDIYGHFYVPLQSG